MLLAPASPLRSKLSSVAASFTYQPRSPAAAQSFKKNASPATSLLQQLHRRPGLFAEAVKMAAVLVFPYCKRSDPCTTAPASFCSSSPAPPFFFGPRTCGGEPSPGYQPPMQSRTQLCVPGSAAFELQHHFSVFSSPSSPSLPVWPSSPPPV